VKVVFDEMTFRSLRTLPGPLKKQQQENKFLAIAAVYLCRDEAADRESICRIVIGSARGFQPFIIDLERENF
jgi:hypothetical protein